MLRRNRSREKSYAFDRAFGPAASQHEVYTHSCEQLLPAVLQGYNVTIFAFVYSVYARFSCNM